LEYGSRVASSRKTYSWRSFDESYLMGHTVSKTNIRSEATVDGRIAYLVDIGSAPLVLNALMMSPSIVSNTPSQ